MQFFIQSDLGVSLLVSNVPDMWRPEKRVGLLTAYSMLLLGGMHRVAPTNDTTGRSHNIVKAKMCPIIGGFSNVTQSLEALLTSFEWMGICCCYRYLYGNAIFMFMILFQSGLKGDTQVK